MPVPRKLIKQALLDYRRDESIPRDRWVTDEELANEFRHYYGLQATGDLGLTLRQLKTTLTQDIANSQCFGQNTTGIHVAEHQYYSKPTNKKVLFIYLSSDPNQSVTAPNGEEAWRPWRQASDEGSARLQGEIRSYSMRLASKEGANTEADRQIDELRRRIIDSHRLTTNEPSSAAASSSQASNTDSSLPTQEIIYSPSSTRPLQDQDQRNSDQNVAPIATDTDSQVSDSDSSIQPTN